VGFNRLLLYAEADEPGRDVGDPTCVVANAGICRGKTILDATKRDIELYVRHTPIYKLEIERVFLDN